MSQSGASPRKSRRRRGLRRGGAALLLALIALAVVFRAEIATRAAVAYLESRGVAVQALDVAELTPDIIELRNVALGEARELTAARVELAPSFAGFAFGLEAARIEGLTLRLDLTGAGPLLGSLQPALDRLTAGGGEAEEDAAAGDVAATPTLFPRVTLDGGVVILLTPSGPMTATLDGGLAPDGAGGTGARADLQLDSELGRLRADLVSARSAAGELAFTAEVAEGRLGWQGFAVGAFNGHLAFEQRPEGAPRLSADLALSDLAYTPAGGAPAEGTPLRLASGRLTADGDLADLALSLRLKGDGEYLDFQASAQRSSADGGEALALALQAEVRTAGGLAQFLPLPKPRVTGGTLVLQAAGKAALPDDDLPDDGLPDDGLASWPALVDGLAQSRVSLSGDAIFGGVALAGGSTGISAHLPLAVELASGHATLTLSDDAAVRVERPSQENLRQLGVPDDLLPVLASGLNLTLLAAGELPFRLTAAPPWPPRRTEVAVAARATSDQGLSLALRAEGSAEFADDLALAGFAGSIEGTADAKSLSLGGRAAQGVMVALPLDARYDAQGLRLALARPGTLRIAQFGATTPLQLQAPLVFEIAALAVEAGAAGGYSYRLSGKEDGAAFAIAAAGTEPVAVTAGALALQLEGRFDPAAGHVASLAARLGGLGLPGYGFAAEAAELDVTLDRELRPAESRFALAPFHFGGEAPVTEPLKLSGTLQRAGAGYDLAGELALSEGQALADLTGRYGDDGRANVKAVSRLLSFAQDGLQPAALSPLLAGLENVSGRLTASARLAWPRDPAGESARLTLAGLSFKSQGTEVNGLDLDVALDGLLPPASPPGQRLTIRSLDPGVPLEAIELVFALDAAPQPRLAVAQGGFDLGGARWRIAPTVLDPAAAQNRVVLATEGLDLAAFCDLIGIDGVNGSGTLAGSLPVVFAGGDIIVEDGRFEALGPGRLSIRIAALRSALAGGGAAVEAAVRALEDFHYDELSLSLAKTAANDATVKLSILGQNPEVMEGQPFRFNINLESNLTSVLEALRQGYSLSDDALRRAWRLSE